MKHAAHMPCARRSTAPEPATVKEAWESYRSRVLATASLEQIESAQNLFYSGAMVGFTLAMDLADLPGTEALERLAVIQDEFKAHGEQMKRRISTETHR